MESIDALRDWWRDRFPVMDKQLGIEFRWRIEAIESEVKANRVDAYTKGYDEGFASADDWAAQHEDAMAESGWVRLPVDAEGQPIRIGDVLDGYGKTIEVVELRHGRSGWVLISRDGNGYADTFAFAHHAPTVEDVLRKLIHRYDELRLGPNAFDPFELVETFAAKLALRGDE